MHVRARDIKKIENQEILRISGNVNRFKKILLNK